MEDNSREQHRLITAGLPDWLVDVPLDVSKPVLVALADGKTISTEMLSSALQTEVGSTVGSISIDPQLVNIFAQWTENSVWGNLPTEPTSVSRRAEDTWEVKVGDLRVTLSRSDIEAKLAETLGDAAQ